MDSNELQLEELEAIEAIYMDDYSRNKKKGPAEFVLQLTPLQSMTTEDVHAKLNLRVVYTTKYPYDPPILKLEKVKGISDENIAQLKAKLDKMAVDLCGEVMVLQLAHHIQAFLHSHNKPNLSFFEQMLQNQTQMEEKEQQEQLKLKQQKCEEDRLKDEAIMRQVKKELVKREVLKDKRKRQISQSSPMNSFSERSSGDAVATATTFTCSRNKDRKMSVVVFKNQERKLFCSACIGHFFPGACTLTGIEENSGKLMSIIEWKAKVSKKNVSADTKQDIAKQIQSIEQEFYFLSTKIECNGLTNYLMLDTNQDNTSLAIKILCDSVQGTPLSSYLCTAGASLSFIHHVCTQLVPVLLYMHNKSVVHKDLNLCNTMVTCSNDILVSGYAVVYRVSEFVRQYAEDDVIEHSFAHLQNYVKIGKKGDVFNMGLILLSLYTGVTGHEFPVSIPNEVPEPFKSFLEKCLEVDESKRFTIQQASQHRFLLEKVNPGIRRQETTNLHGGGGGAADEKQEVSADMLTPLLWNGRVLLGKSRLISEFGDFEWLGKGGFGSVLKVRNKLDSNFYAIKRVPLNPKSLNLNKRITREVKLLSRLNHENVVRYFNSWIEAEDVTLPSLESTTDSDSIIPPQRNNQPKKPAVLEERRPLEESLLGKIRDDFDFGKDEREATEDFSWADISEPRAEIESSSSSSSFEDSEAVQRRINLSKRSRSTRKESSEGVVFEVDDSVLQFGDELDSEDSDEEVTTTPTTQTTTESTDDSSATLQYLYIQMEFCEKLTLRTAIDENLYQQPDRAWKLFREIVEGISHVHAQGIIHRDLKPVNIFMDSSDRIKIGDFGLATSHGTVDTSSLLQNNHSNLTDEKMTGKVGTTLYVAPELGRAHSRVKFSHKVDMYSLGIIMFEMFYRPLSTGMERVNTIAALRSENVVFPEDFMPGKKQTKVRVVINWLLKHDAEGRPTSQELLESGYVPPKMEDSQMDELIKHTLQQSNSTRYQRLVSAFFAQKVSPVADQIYDSDFYGKNEEQVSKRASILQNVQDTLQGVFRKHGGVFIETPLLTPRGKAFENTSKVATVIDASGLQLCLPYDSRVSFARYVTRNNITNMRRYCLGKLYRDQGMRGAHPVALWDCSFDIVSDSFTSCLPEAELIYIVCEIIYEFPALAQRNFFIRLNHMSFMKAIFLQNNFSDSTEQDIMSILEHTRERKLLENELKDYFMSMGLTDHYISKLLNYFMFEGSLAKAKEALQGLRKTKQNVSNCAKQAFACIERTLKHLSNMEIELPVQISTSLVPNAQHYSGLVFQFVAENTRKKRHGGYDILAVGGCYDRLVTSMSKYAELTELPRSVGVSIAVEKIIAAVQKTCDALPNNNVIVCSLTGNIQQLVQVLHELWSTGISASLFSYEVDQNYTVEEIQEHCKEKGINHIVIIKESQPNFVRVKSREKDKFSEIRILPRKELCDYLHQKNSVEVPVKDMEALQKVTSLPPPSQGAMYESLFFTFVSIDKIDSGKKKRFENSFRSKFYNEAMFRNSEVQVVVAKLDREETRAVAAHVELSRGVEEFEASVRSLIDMFKEQGAFMRRVCNTLFKLYSETHALVVLYSYIEEYYRIVS